MALAPLTNNEIESAMERLRARGFRFYADHYGAVYGMRVMLQTSDTQIHVCTLRHPIYIDLMRSVVNQALIFEALWDHTLPTEVLR